MDFSFPVKRRTVLKILVGGASVSLGVTSIPAAAHAFPIIGNCGTQPTGGSLAPAPAWAPVAGVAKWRIDGLCKVMGKKIYARDYHAADLPGWPDNEQFLYAIRCNRNDQIVTGYNLDMLPAGLKPSMVIDAALLRAKMIQTPDNMSKPFFVSPGSAADYYGQPVAMLIFDSFNAYRRAKKILQFNDNVIQYGAPFTHTNTFYSPLTSYVRNDATRFNYVNNNTSDNPNYKAELASNIILIRDAIKNNGWATYSRNFFTPTADPVFMEPESGMSWYDTANKTLHILLGTQSPTGDIVECGGTKGAIFYNSAYTVNNVELISCYPGGGFGGRDSSFFTNYLAMASVFAKGALRWSQDRFEQFQTGLKRQETVFNQTLAIGQDGMIKAIDCAFTMNGGGQKNLNPYVAALAALSAASCYNIPQAIANGSATATPQLSGGSQRGFGGPQAYIAIETLLDEAADALKIDPFALRRKNLLQKGVGMTVSGAPILQHLQLPEMMRHLESHSLWRHRKARQRMLAAKGLKYGVGFAMSNQAYGTSSNGMFGAVQINRDGSLLAHTTYIDMGNGAATALGLAPAAWLGRNASAINMGEAALFNALGLTTDKEQSGQPNYVLKGSGSSSACLGAFHQYHPVENAALVLLIQTVLPALTAIWNTSGITAKDITWKDGAASAKGHPSVPWASVIGYIFAHQLPTIAAVHASIIGVFSTASFALGGGNITLDLDYIALGTELDALAPITRGELTNPPPENARFGRYAYSPCGALVALSVDGGGNVKVERVVSALSAGVLHCPPVVEGQSQGGVAMAMGDVLLGGCPNDNSGPGNGTWNFNQYKITRFADIPTQELIILPPATGETTARGIAESVMCPIAPAILNALAMATGGKRFTQLPVTAAKILEALA
jgi:CO/xanthine dehydrogenase Mo-binding subunit